MDNRSRQMAFFVFTKVGKGGAKAGLFHVILKHFGIKKAFRYYIKQMDSMLRCVCSVIDHRRRQNVIRASVTHSATFRVPLFLFLPHFDVICDLLLNRRSATWNLFVKQQIRLSKSTCYPLFAQEAMEINLCYAT